MKNLNSQLKTIVSKSNLIPFLVGPHGSGKTSFIKEWAKSQGKTCITLNLSAVEAVELTGMPTTVEGRMTYARPFFYDYDVLFLDELNRVSDSSVKSALALAQAMSLPVNQDGSKFASFYAKLTVALDRLDAQAPVATRVVS